MDVWRRWDLIFLSLLYLIFYIKSNKKAGLDVDVPLKIKGAMAPLFCCQPLFRKRAGIDW
jgi:hypothetical protein